MTAFDRDDLSRNDFRPERGYPRFLDGNTPIWLAAIAVVGAFLIGVFAYESDNSGTFRPVYTHDVPPVSAPTVIPAPEPPPVKP
jgi:hypothetical protein